MWVDQLNCVAYGHCLLPVSKLHGDWLTIY